MREVIKALFFIGLAAAVLAIGAILGYARFNECRRVHPLWYCMSDK